jgi:hypothetical protein
MGAAVVLIAALAVSSGAVSISSRAGTATAQFLKLEMGGRHAAMGGTYAGYGSDVFTLWGQPAAIANAPSAWQIGFQHTEWFQGVNQDYLGVTGPVGHRARAGLVVNTAGVNGLLRATENADGTLAATGGTFGARDLAVSAHYGMRMSEVLSLGGALRVVNSKLDNVSATGFAADLGARLRIEQIQGLTLGVSVTNVGTGLKYIRDKDDFPWAIRVGGAYEVPRANLLLAGDLVKFSDRDIDGGVGVEWRPIDFVRLRGGYRTQGRDVGKGLTGGIGFNFAGLELDYAYVPFGVLGESHRISASYLFGGGGVDASVRPTAVAPAPAPAPAAAKPAPVVNDAPRPLRRYLD